MVGSSERPLVQSVLKFGQKRTGDEGDRSKSPYFVKQTQSQHKEPLSQVTWPPSDEDEDEDLDMTASDSEMEDIQQTQTSAASTSESRNAMRMAHERATRRRNLRRVAQETTDLLPRILSATPWAPPKGYLYSFPQPPRLHRKYCPNLPNTRIRVLDADTLDTAIGLAKCAQYVTVRDKRPVCVLNMANAYHAGGGWKNGAVAQEEAICYRSSLSFTLKLRHYPIPELGAIYSPSVVVFRKNMTKGHAFSRLDEPEKLPVVSVISVAALCEPGVVMAQTESEDDSPPRARQKFADPQDRDLTKDKIRVILRTAAYNGHRRLVLGALGCGAFLNPREEVADCFAEVFGEQEFSGGWWESILFAVMDDLGQGEDGDGNFGVFYRTLHDVIV